MVRRLSETTRKMAEEALTGKWGKALEPTKLVLTKKENKEPNAYLRSAYCVRHIAEKGPIRILPEEKLVGACTLAESPMHVTPVRDPDGNIAIGSLSHCTPGFYEVLEIGLKGLRSHVDERLARGNLDKDQIKFLHSLQITLDAMGTWHKRYIALLRKLIRESDGELKLHYEQVLKNLKNVPENKPKNFREAIQSLLFMFVFMRQCGDWPGIGRIDVMLGKYLEKDLKARKITLDEAREYIAHFWIKGCEWIGRSEIFDGSGDGQHYQNIILSGVDKDGNEVVNDVTYLVLDVVEELRISDFPIAVRVSKRTPEKLFRRIAEVQRLGSGTVAIYNNDFIINNLYNFGYPLEEARNFANDGCWEIQIPGKTCFSYHPIDILVCLQQALGLEEGTDAVDYPTFEDLYKAYDARVQHIIGQLMEGADNFGYNGIANTLFSLFTDGCIESAKGYYHGGAKYKVLSPHTGGVPDVANELYAIKKLVYDEKKFTLSQVREFLRSDWQGNEPLRQQMLKECDHYGNGHPEVDEMARRVLHDFSRFAKEIPERNGVKRPAGISTFGREVSWREGRKATFDGHKAGEILAANLTPTPGTDKNGPTAGITSHCSLDLTCLVNGTALDMKISPSAVRGEDGIKAMVGLYKTFIEKGGIFIHIDVVDNKTLLDAAAHPEKYPTLAVRVSGWSARFVTLNPHWQQMIIKKTEQH